MQKYLKGTDNLPIVSFAEVISMVGKERRDSYMWMTRPSHQSLVDNNHS